MIFLVITMVQRGHKSNNMPVHLGCHVAVPRSFVIAITFYDSKKNYIEIELALLCFMFIIR